MPWTNPKTDWDKNPINPTSADFNRIERNIEFLNTDIETKKGLIVDAITAKGIAASIADTFSTLATKIGQIIKSVGTATADKVLSDYTFSNDTSANINGTMPNNGPASSETINLTSQNQEYTIAQGYHTGFRKIKAVITNLSAGVIKSGITVGGILGTFTSDATAAAGDILSGITAYVNGSKITGTMVDQGTKTQTLSTQGASYTIPAGKHSGLGKVIASFANLVAGNIKQGVNVGGVVGTLEPKLFASGIASSGDTGLSFKNLQNNDMTRAYITVSGLTFKPICIICIHEGASYYTRETIYWDGVENPIPNAYYPKEVRMSTTYLNSSSQTTDHLKGDVSSAYVNATGFRLPVTTYSASYNWFAFG